MKNLSRVFLFLLAGFFFLPVLEKEKNLNIVFP